MKNLSKLLFSIFLIISSVNAFSQHTVKGIITDSVNQNPVEYASVSVYQSADSKLLNGTLTDSTGNFVINELKSGSYFIKITAIGFKDKFIRDIQIQHEKIADLGKIAFQETPHSVDEVVVTGQKKETATRIDKQVYKASQFESVRGGTAIDVLKNMPSISVNGEGEIRFRGSTGFLVLINGKPVITDINTVLSQIPANAIENIELITSPSAKYDADGKAGIINITTKRGTDEGISVVVNTQLGAPSVNAFENKEKPKRYGADATLNYKKGKWDVSLGGSYQENDIAGRRIGDVNTTIENRYTSFPSEGERSFKRRNYSARASVIFTPSKSNSINVGAYMGQRRQYRLADITYNNTKTDINTGDLLSSSTFFNSNLVKKQGDFSLINLDYTHTFKNKSTLTFSGLYEYALLDGFTKNLNVNRYNHLDTLDYVVNTGNSPINGLRGKVDYSTTIAGGKLESGYQIRVQKQTGRFLYQNAIIGTSNYETVSPFSDDIEIDNLIHGLYTQYSGKKGKLEYMAGLRYEYATRTFSAKKQAQPYNLELSNLFPSANLLYSLAPTWKAKAGFSSRVQRSTNNELNPLPEREHSETLEQGDPQIKPEMVYLSELGLTKELKTGSLFFTVYNQQIHHVVNRVNSVYNDTILNRIYTNAGNARLWGLEAGLNIKPVPWWTAYIGGNVYDYKIQGSLFNNAVQVNNGAVAYSINTNHTFLLNKKWSIQFNLNYLSERPTAQGTDSRFISPNASVKRIFLDGKFTATLQWQNIGLGFIPSNEQRITTSGSNFYTTTNYIQEKDVLMLNLSFNLNKKNKKFKLPTSEFGEKEF